MRAISTAAFALALIAGCSAADGSEHVSDESDLIGGTAARVEELPSTVHLEDGCTAAKVAPRLLLTAAHCVLDLSTLEPKFDATRPAMLSRDPSGGHTAHAITKVHVHPAWMRACAETLCSISAVTAKLDAPDVALIELAEDLAGVPLARIDRRPLAPGDKVILVGFGCTEGVHVADARKRPSLASAETAIVAASAALHDGSPVSAANAPVYSGNYALTPGPGAPGVHAGLCPGDSGGPLYARRENGTLVVVGVNANYTLRTDAVDAVGLPVTNWHTRLDDASRNQVHAWLQTIVTDAP